MCAHSLLFHFVKRLRSFHILLRIGNVNLTWTTLHSTKRTCLTRGEVQFGVILRLPQTAKGSCALMSVLAHGLRSRIHIRIRHVENLCCALVLAQGAGGYMCSHMALTWVHMCHVGACGISAFLEGWMPFWVGRSVLGSGLKCSLGPWLSLQHCIHLPHVPHKGTVFSFGISHESRMQGDSVPVLNVARVKDTVSRYRARFHAPDVGFAPVFSLCAYFFSQILLLAVQLLTTRPGLVLWVDLLQLCSMTMQQSLTTAHGHAGITTSL